jgi:hypothetical protein
MKTIYHNIILLASILLLFAFCGCEEVKVEKQPVNYVVLLDLSDRILAPEQLDKDFALIETTFKSFEKQARQNLVISSKDRFRIKIIPQKNSPLNVNHFEDLLQLYLDETEVAIKNKSLVSLSKTLPKILENLKKEAMYGETSNKYFGVDIWAYLHDNGMGLSKAGYENKILILTDGYFDFESQAHVIQDKNQYTSTRFLNDLTTSNWKLISESQQYGLLPIQLDKNTKWIVAGISGKKANDILQTEKITYFWEKWLKQSGVKYIGVILNSSRTDMSSKLSEQI